MNCPSLLRRSLFLLIALCLAVSCGAAFAADDTPPAWPDRGDGKPQHASFPLPLGEYQDAGKPVAERLQGRMQREPFNVAASVIFSLAILHTFLAGFFLKKAHQIEDRNRLAGRAPHSASAGVMHFLGEVEAIFLLWGLPLFIAAAICHGWGNAVKFTGKDCNFTEPLFVIVIMAISASKPVVDFAERLLSAIAMKIGKGSPAAWWLSTLTVAPLLGSVITEPAAMTIAAMILLRRFYSHKPGRVLAYATLGLLFVNVSVGGVLTNFAAPPVLMVARKWEWSSWFMLSHFGWRAVLGLLASTGLYWLMFRGQLAKLTPVNPVEIKEQDDDLVPRWITTVHLGFLLWTVLTNHYPALFLGGFLFFLAFTQITSQHQTVVAIRGPLLVGVFLAGLVLHGTCQGWWLEPLIGSGLGEWPLMLGATALTGFNDNALITFLSSQVQGLSDGMKYAVMAGAVAGGGLTVIANAPNPAGQGILKPAFGGSVSPLGLLAAALLPTGIVVCAFMLTR